MKNANPRPKDLTVGATAEWRGDRERRIERLLNDMDDRLAQNELYTLARAGRLHAERTA